jgi:hypothetical protein
MFVLLLDSVSEISFSLALSMQPMLAIVCFRFFLPAKNKNIKKIRNFACSFAWICNFNFDFWKSTYN